MSFPCHVGLDQFLILTIVVTCFFNLYLIDRSLQSRYHQWFKYSKNA